MLIGAEGFYSINNPFQIDGPKGYTERKMIGLRDIFVRIDLPGVGQDDVHVTIHDSKKGVIIKASAPILNIHDSSTVPRIYETYVMLYCDCCEVSSFHNPQVTDKSFDSEDSEKCSFIFLDS
ncbi:HSP20-like chaperone [Raphanus sativus]|nr:HSP20-like chaperone [Raphanus sativus]